MDLKEYSRLTEQADRLAKEAERAAGALEQVLAELLATHGCENLAAAHELLQTLIQQEEQARQAYVAMDKKWQQQYGDQL